MDYEPSRRRPPRQERWPRATPAGGWPSYQDGDRFEGEDRAARPGAYQVAEGYQGRSGYPQAADGSGYWPAVATAPFPPGGNVPPRENEYGYAETQDGYDWTTDGDGYGGDGYGYGGGSGYHGEDGYRGENGNRTPGYDTGAGNEYGTANEYGAANGYGTANGYGAANEYGAANGSTYRTGGYPSGGYPSGGYPSGGYPSGGYPSGGRAAGIDGYAAAPDGFDGAPGRYQHRDGGYGTPTREHPGDARGYDGYGYGAADGYAGSPDELTAVGGDPDVAGSTEPGPSGRMLVAPDADVRPDTGQADEEQRRQARRRGLVVGAVTGLLAVAVGIGVSILAAAFVGPQASPAAATGSVFIDRTPAVLRNLAGQHFGAHGHAVLLLGMYAGIAVLAIGAGLLTRRSAALGVAGLAAFSLFAAFVTVTRPGSRVSDVAPAIVGGLAAIAALLWLVRASAPVAPPPAHGGARRRAR